MSRPGLRTGHQSSRARLQLHRFRYGLIPILALVCLFFFLSSNVKDVAGDTPPAADPPPSGLDTRPVSQTCVAPGRTQQVISAKVVVAFPNLSFDGPIDLVQAPNDDMTWYLAERKGLIHTFANREDVETTATALDIRDRMQFTGNDDSQQWGITTFTFHPQFPAMPYLYVGYNAKERADSMVRSVVSRFETTDGGQTFDPSSEVILLTQSFRRRFHHLGNIAFGPDGYLYIGFGEGNDRNWGERHDLNSWLGVLLRIDINSTLPYAIPPDNPLAGTGLGQEELFAWGFRNPWRFSFDRQTGDIWLGDVGGSRWEEINLVKKGGDYGWTVLQGNECNRPPCDAEGLIPPVYTYDHSMGQAIIGGFVYRGSAIPGLIGTYIFGDVSTNDIFGLTYDDEGVPQREVIADGRGNSPPQTFAQSNDGEIYFMTVRSRQQIKTIVPDIAPQVAATSFPARLSETGCVDPADPRRPAAGTIPYRVNSPLWSDGAEKQRWMAIPEASQIVAQVDGDFEFPIGTVLVKSFAFDDQPVETRLLVRHNDGGWAGYSYEWLDDGSDAVLLEDGKTKVLTNGQTWAYPSPLDCMVCHTEVARFALGPELAQLNSDFEYPSTGRTANQLVTLQHVGVLHDPRQRPPGNLPVLAAADEEDRSIEDRARSYLHANCSGCHRQGGPTQSLMDLRFFVAKEGMQVCNVAPQLGDLGIENAALIAGGSPERSIVYQRMNRRDEHQMPPLGTLLVDTVAVQVMESWILNEEACPAAAPVTDEPPAPPEPIAPPDLPEPPTCLGLAATIVGTPGDDHIAGTNGHDVIVALGGNDLVKGRGGDDVICGGDGDDDLRGGTGNDTLLGGNGNDILAGKQDNDLLVGEQGDDLLLGNAGDDILEGGDGDDYCHGGPHENGDEADSSCEAIRKTP